jgi:putative transposase
VGRGGLAEDSKKARDGHAHLVLIDETGLFLNPLVRRSWAVCGQTPLIGGDGGHRRKVSAIGAISVSPRTRRLGLHFDTRADGFFGAAEVLGFLRYLLGTLAGKVIVVWDGGTNHKGPLVRAYLARTRRLWLERLPAYAPELNPVEQVWSWLKYGQLANFVPDDLAELDDEIIDQMIQLRDDPQLLRSLWDGSELPFPEAHSR